MIVRYRRPTSGMGQTRKSARFTGMSVLPSIVLQKSQNRARQFSRQKMKQAMMADCYGVRLVKEVAGELIVR
jgi:hypothetical protein